MPISWKQQWVVSVTKGRKTRYFYGTKLADAMKCAGLKKGDIFGFARFARSAVKCGEKMERKDCYIDHGTWVRRSAFSKRKAA